MKAFKTKKLVVLLALPFLLITDIFASSFVLKNDSLIDERAVKKIDEIGNETRRELGVNIYVYAQNSLGLPENTPTKDKIEFIKKQESELVKKLTKPYVVLTMAVDDTHVNLIVSSRLKDIVKKDEILNDYVIPLLASKDKNSLFAKVSASVLNGYAAIADTIAQHNKVKLKSSIGSSGKVVSSVWKVFMYTLVVAGLLLYVFAILKRRK